MSLTKEDTRAGSKCLVCYAPFARSKLKRSSWDDSSSGLPSSALDKQLSAMFVLQNLLEVPSERLQLFLTGLGNPALWIWVCPKCNGNVRNAMAVYEELLKVFKRFMVLKGRIVEEIRESCDKAPSTSGGGGEMLNLAENKLWITDESRHYVVTHDYGPFKNPFASGDTQARQLTKSGSSTVLWVESKEVAVISNSSPSSASSPMVDLPQVEKQVSIKIELDNEEGYCDDSLPLDYGELEQESSQNSLRRFRKQRKQRSNRTKPTAVIIKIPEISCTDQTNEDEEQSKNSQDDDVEMDGDDKEWTPEDLTATKIRRSSTRTTKRTRRSKLGNGRRYKKSEFGEHLLNCTLKDPLDPEGDEMDNRIPLHDDVRKHQCDECPSFFTTSPNLQYHKWREHTPLDKNVNPLVCKYCDKLINNPYYLRTHIALVHEQTFKVFCHICGFGEVHQSRLNRHMITAHKIGKPRVWKCTIEGCDKVFRNTRDLESHKNKHRGTPQFPCDICGKGFYRKSHMSSHRQIHTNAESKPFVCELCGKGFSLRNYLYIHMKSHRNK